MYKSNELFTEAKCYIPGGVNSPVRSFNAVLGTPPFIKEGLGAYLIDEDDKRYIDYVCSWGANIVGHAHPRVVNAVQRAAERGLSFGAATQAEVALAKKICKLIPGMERVRMVNSGTEATMSAIRLARGVTGRDKIVKFSGCYHGHADSLLVKGGSGLLTFGIPSCPGIPADIAQHTLTAEFNDTDQVMALFEKYGQAIAAIIVEPVACNMNCILPKPGFLEGLRQVCDQYGSLLIFDEVITGFRLGLNGAQGYYGITPDLTTLGKIIGGGLPVGAYGGKRVIMDHIAPIGLVYQAGTLSGNPVAMAAGLATLAILEEPKFYEQLAAKTNLLVSGLQELASEHGIALQTQSLGSIFGLFFTTKVTRERYQDVASCDQTAFRQFFHKMLAAGVYLAPSAYEAGFVSSAHSEADIQGTLAIADQVFREMV